MRDSNLMSQVGARAVHELLMDWPDETEQAHPYKGDSWWSYVDRKRKSFDGVLAFGIRGWRGNADTPYIVVEFDPAGTATEVDIVDEGHALTCARLAVEASYEDWLQIVRGYDIGKAMTYHKLPLRVGSAIDMLRNVYLVYELINIFIVVHGGQRINDGHATATKQ